MIENNSALKYKPRSEIVKLSYYSENDSFGILVICINRPDKLNALSENVLSELINVFDYYLDNDIVRGIILTGSGDKAFVAGADIKQMSTMNSDQAYLYSKKGHELCNLVSNYKKPVIAAVNGFALGGGCELALSCHMRFSSNNAVFAQPEVKLGIIAGWGGTQRLFRLIGPASALDIHLSGRMVNAEEAKEMGLINGIFSNNLIEESLTYLKSIISNSPNALDLTIEALNYGLNNSLVDSLEYESQLFRDSFKHNDSKVGLSAFLKKEKPQF